MISTRTLVLTVHAIIKTYDALETTGHERHEMDLDLF